MAGVLYSCVIIAIFCLAKYTSSEPFQAKRYTINLDLPAEQRWVNITKKYIQYVPEIRRELQKKIPKEALPLAEILALYLDKHFPEPFPNEMRGVAKGFNITLAEVTLMNIFYDLTAFCTSIVVQQPGNKGILHGRNLDYDFSDLLRNLTFMVDFESKGTERNQAIHLWNDCNCLDKTRLEKGWGGVGCCLMRGGVCT